MIMQQWNLQEWSSLIANYLIKYGYSAEVLDAEAENLTHEQTAEKNSFLKNQNWQYLWFMANNHQHQLNVCQVEKKPVQSSMKFLQMR